MFTDLFLKLLNREAASPKRKSKRIIETLRITKGGTIADIGSGGGYFTLEFARRVGENGKVYAVDNKPQYLDFVKRQSGKIGLNNIEFITGGSGAANLPTSSLDLIFARNVFHHLPEPTRYFRDLKKTLKPGGRVAIIDHTPKKRLTFVNLFKHFTPVEEILETMESAGYRLSESFDFLPAQAFMVFSSSSDEKR